MADIASLTFNVDSSPVRRAESDLKSMASEGRRVERETAGSTDKMNKSFGGLRTQISLVAGAIAALGVTRELRTMVQTLAGFEQAMARTKAVSRATASEFEAMNKIARELGATTEFTASQAAFGLEFMALAGFKARESIAALPAVLDLATAASMDLGRAADIASNIMSAFGMEAERAAEVSDVLAAVNARANTTVEQLGDAMRYVGPVASALGITINTTAAAVGVLSDAGIQGSAAGTGLRRVLSSLVNPTSQAKSVLDSLGVTLDEVNPNVVELEDIISRLASAGLDASDALKIFGDRGGPAILALIENSGNLQDLVETMRDVEGASKSMAEIMRDTLQGDFYTVQAAAEGLRIALASTFTPQIREAAQKYAGALSAVTEALESGDYEGHLRFVGDIAVAVSSAATAYVGIRGALLLAAAAQGVFNAAARANPYIMLATTLAALAPLVIRYTRRVEESTKANREWFESFNLMPGVVASTGRAAGLTAEEIEALTRSTIRDFEARRDSVSSLRDFNVAMLDSQKSVQAVIEALDREYLLLTMTARQRMAYQAIEEAGIGITLRDAVAIRERVDAIFDLKDAQEEAERTAREAARGARTLRDSWSSLSDQADQTGTAVSSMLENIQREWGNTFYNMDFTAKGFFGSVTDGFRRMLSEMASKDLVSSVLRGGGMSAITGGSVAGLISGGSQFLGGMLGRGAGIAAGTMGPPTAAAASGASMGAFLTNPWTIGIAGALLAADRLTGGDGKVRQNAGMFVAPTPGADPSRSFAVDPFASGLNVTGFARRAEQDQAREVISIFRDIDASLTGMVGALGGTLDMTKKIVWGLDEEATTGSHGTFLGLGGNSELTGDLDSQVQMFFNQLVENVEGLDAALLASVRSAGSVEAAFDIMTREMEKSAATQERLASVMERVDYEIEKALTYLGGSFVEPLGDFLLSLSGLENAAAVSRVREYAEAMHGLDGALVDALNSTNDINEMVGVLGRAMYEQQQVAAAEEKIQRDRLNAIKEEHTALRLSADLNRSILGQLQAASNRLGVMSDSQLAMGRSQATHTLRSMVGGTIDQDALSRALGVATQDASRLYSNIVDFARDQGITANLIAQLTEQTEDQLGTEELQLAALDQQLIILTGTKEEVASAREALEDIYAVLSPASNDPVFDPVSTQTGYAESSVSGTVHAVPDGRSVSVGRPESENEELKSIREELAQIREATRSTAMHTNKSSKQLERWDIDGMPEVREAI